MSATPAVSIILPTYNRASLISRTIRSVLAQTFTNFELIIIDDASTDNTMEIIRAFQDPRIRIIRHEQNQGEANSRNSGLANTTADYVAFIDSDDEWMPRKLEKQIQLFETLPLRTGVVVTGFCFSTGKETFSPTIPAHRGNVYEQMLRGCFIISIVPLIRRACFEHVGNFNTELTPGTDWEMWIRIAEHYDFEVVPEVLAVYHLHGNQLSSNLAPRIHSWNVLLNKYQPVLATRPLIAAGWLRHIGELLALDGKVRESRRFIIQSIRTYPWQKGSYLLLLLSLLPFAYGRMLRKYFVRHHDGLFLYH